ncbi:MAG: hypothetical protein WAZ27_00610 [Minisyncoccia bacterium]
MDGLISIALLLEAVAQLVISVLLIAVLWYALGVLKNLRAISERVERGSAIVSNDLYEFHAAIKSESAALWYWIKSMAQRVPHAFASPDRKSSKKTRAQSEGMKEAV